MSVPHGNGGLDPRGDGNDAPVSNNRPRTSTRRMSRHLVSDSLGHFQVQEVEDSDLSRWQQLVQLGDIFGYDPDDWKKGRNKVRHECGCFATVSIIAFMIVIMVLGVFEYADDMTIVMESKVANNSQVHIQKDFRDSRIGLSCCNYDFNANDHHCDVSGYLHIQWQQRSINDQNQATKSKTLIEGKDCEFELNSNNVKTRAYCPKTNALELQGFYEADKYRYVQVDVTHCSNSTSTSTCYSSADREKFIAGGTCAFIFETIAPSVGDIKNTGVADVDFQESTDIRQSRFYFIQGILIRVDVKLTLFQVAVESFLVRVRSWIQYASYLLYSSHEVVYGTPSAGDAHKVMTFYFGMEKTKATTVVTPFITLLKMVGSWGSLFTVVATMAAASVFLVNLYIHERQALVDVITMKKSLGKMGPRGTQRIGQGAKAGSQPFTPSGKSVLPIIPAQPLGAIEEENVTSASDSDEEDTEKAVVEEK